MVSLNSQYNQYMYPAVKGGMNYAVNRGEVARAMKYANGEPMSSSHDMTYKDAAIGIPIGLGFMGAINGIVFTCTNWWGKPFSHFKDAIKNGWNNVNSKELRPNRGWDIMRYHYDRMSKLSKGTIDGILANANAGERAHNAANMAKNYYAQAAAATDTKVAAEFTKKAQLFEGKAKRWTVSKPATTWLGQSWEFVKKPFKKLGETSVMKTFGNTTAGKMFYKGGGPFIVAIEGAIETFTEIIPTFKKRGFAAGIKQIGKSLVKTAASVTGFVVGEAVGAPIGAAIGMAVGGPLGAAIGGFIGGLAGGMFASVPAVGLARALTGKSEMTKQREEEEHQKASLVMQNPEQMRALAEANLKKAQEEVNNGKGGSSTNAAISFGSRVTGGNNPFA